MVRKRDHGILALTNPYPIVFAKYAGPLARVIGLQAGAQDHYPAGIPPCRGPKSIGETPTWGVASLSPRLPSSAPAGAIASNLPPALPEVLRLNLQQAIKGGGLVNSTEPAKVQAAATYLADGTWFVDNWTRMLTSSVLVMTMRVGRLCRADRKAA